MTTYTKRDIRAADMLAMILVGLGVALLLFAVMPLLVAKSGKAAGGPGPWIWVAAATFLVLGTALQLKVRQLIRNGGREPDDYPGVPD